MLAYLIKAGYSFLEIEPRMRRQDNRILLEKDLL
jgi:hypothetical protein